MSRMTLVFLATALAISLCGCAGGGAVGGISVSGGSSGVSQTSAQVDREPNSASDFEVAEVKGGVAVTNYTGQSVEVVIPRSISGSLVVEIADEAFRNKSALTYVQLPDGVERVGREAFSGCTSLETIGLPGSLNELGEYAFAGTRIDKAILPDGVGYVSENSFPDGCELIRTDGDRVELYTAFSRLEIDDGAITRYMGDATSVRIYPYAPDGKTITAVAESAFKGHTNLAEIILPDGILSIGASAFEGCSSLAAIDLPDGLVEIGERAFWKTGLTEVVLPSGVPIPIEKGTFPDECALSTPDGGEVEVMWIDEVTGFRVVEFGSYQQSSSTPEPIEWLVVKERADGTAILLSRYCLDARPYNNTAKKVTWETCTLRAWLNGEFLEEAFTRDEQELIVEADIPNSSNSRYGNEGGADTRDRVFLFSISEIEDLFGVNLDEYDERLVARATSRAIEGGAYVNYNGDNCDWWLRSPGKSAVYAASVSMSGKVDMSGHGVGGRDLAVRPALVVNLES